MTFYSLLHLNHNNAQYFEYSLCRDFVLMGLNPRKYLVMSRPIDDMYPGITALPRIYTALWNDFQRTN